MFSNKIPQSNTGINQSVTSSNTSTTASAVTSSGITTAGLEKGQLIHGEVTDLRNNEVSVKMEDGRTLTGKLEDSKNLSMGDKVVLRVEDVSLKSLTLKIIANTDFSNQNNTIDKALDAAGLSKNEKNYAIVNELLKQQMSIDKNSISLIIRQSLQFKDSSIASLVLMNKLNLPVTENNVKQFEAYTSFENSIMGDLRGLADSITGFFSGTDSLPVSEYIKQSKVLLPILYGNESNPAVTDDTISKLLTMENENAGNLISKDAFSLNNTVSFANSVFLNNNLSINNILNPADLTNFAGIIESDPSLKTFFSDEQLANLKNRSADIKETALTLNLISNQAEAILAASADSTGSSSKVMQLIQSETAQTIMSAAQDVTSNKEIGFSLNTSERLQLLSSLESFVLSSKNSDTEKSLESLKKQITAGTINTTELLKWIQGKLGDASDEASKSLLTSDAFKSLLKEELLSKWTLPPEELGKGPDLNKHYESLLHQLNDLNDFMEQSNKAAGSTIQEQIGHLKENVNFMNNINNLFTYIQIPLKMKNQYTDSQLYVYSKKKNGNSNSDGTSVLLHLNMDHIGTLDVFIELNNKNLSSKFYLENKEVVNLFSSHINQLENILEAKGYTFRTEILPREKKVNIVQDFLDQEAESAGLPRYNFDLRA